MVKTRKRLIKIDDKLSQLVLAFHQIIGGVVGLIYLVPIFTFDDVMFFVPLVCSVLSIAAGIFLFRGLGLILLTQINYVIQIFSVYVYGFMGLSYDLPLSIVWSIQFEEMIIGIDFYTGTHFDFYPDYSSSTSVGINIVAAFLLWFTVSESGFRKDLFEADPISD